MWFRDCVHTARAVVPAGLTGGLLMAACVLLGWWFSRRRRGPLVTWTRWWFDCVARRVLDEASWAPRAGMIAANNILNTGLIVCAGVLNHLSWLAIAFVGLELGAAARLMAGVPTARRGVTDADRGPLWVVMLGIGWTLLEICAILLSVGLSLGQGTLGPELSLGEALACFGVIVVPLLVLAATGEGLWLTAYGVGEADPDACGPTQHLPEGTPMTENRDNPVPDEQRTQVVLVDEHNHEQGLMGKVAAHRGEGRLHRALTCLLFDERGRLLFARRAAAKPLWPGYYDATVATHPVAGEGFLDAARRRVPEELGPQAEVADLQQVTEITYQASYDQDWSEREFCAVLLGRLTGSAGPDPSEIDEITAVSLGELPAFLADRPIAPWFQLAWEKLQRDHADVVMQWLR